MKEKTGFPLQDFFLLWGLYFFSFMVVYFAPPVTKFPFFIILLFLFYVTKRDYLWFAFLIILVARIGDLFPHTAIVEGYSARLPVYNLAGIRLPFVDLFIATIFIKSLFSKIKFSSVIKPWFLLLLVYLFSLYLLSIIFGMSFDQHIITVRSLLPLTLIYSFPRLINKNNEEFYKLFVLLSTAILLVVVAQLIKLTTGFSVSSLITGVEEVSVFDYEYIRVLMSPFLNLIVFVLALFYFAKSKHGNQYVLIVLLLCLFSIFISATRGWIIAYSLVLFLFFLYQLKSVFKLIRIGIFSSLLFLLLMQIPNVDVAIESATKRTQTLYALAEGDITAGGTLKRLDQRGPRVMNKVYESPVVGFGFSSDYWEYADEHVGHQNLLLQVGIAGTILFYLMMAFFIHKVVVYKQQLRISSERHAVNIFIISILCVIIIHSTSTQFIGYILMVAQIEKMLFFSIFFTYADFYLKHFAYNQQVKPNANL